MIPVEREPNLAGGDTQVLEEVLLAPAFEHPVGDFDRAQITTRGNNGVWWL